MKRALDILIAVTRRFSWFLVLIIILGFILRVFNLTQESFWQDEIYSLSFARDFRFFYQDPRPPFYYWLIHPLLKFSESEFLLRLPSVIFSTLSILFIYIIGRQLFSPKMGLYSALLVSFSSFQILWARQARMYSLQVMVELISFIFFLEAIKKNKARDWALFSLFAFLAIFTEFSSIYFISSLFLYGLFHYGKNLFKSRNFGFLLSFLVLASLLSTLFFGVLINSGDITIWIGWIPKPSISSLFQIILSFVSLAIFIPWNFAFKILAAFYLVLGILAIAKLRGLQRTLGILLTFPIVLSLIISFAWMPVVLDRQLITASFPLILLIAFGIGRLNKRFLVFVSLLFFISLNLLAVPQSPLLSPLIEIGSCPREDWRGLGKYLISNIKEGEVILHSPVHIENFTRFYFNKYASPRLIESVKFYPASSGVVKNTKSAYLISEIPHVSNSLFRSTHKLTQVKTIGKTFILFRLERRF